MGASQEQFRIPLCGRGEEARHRGLVFDEFLNRIIHRGRVEVVLRAGLVGGELVNNAAAGSIPQEGDIFIPCRCGLSCMPWSLMSTSDAWLGRSHSAVFSCVSHVRLGLRYVR